MTTIRTRAPQVGEPIALGNGGASSQFASLMQQIVRSLEELATVTAESYTVATLPAATTAGQIIFVSDEAGGAVIAFSDGTNWRRVTDRAVVS